MKATSIAFLIFIVNCNNKQETIKPTKQTITESVYASGIIKSQNQYKVFSTVSGILQKVLVTENDEVKIGSPLFSIVNESQKLVEKNVILASDYNGFTINQGKLKDAQALADLAKQKMSNDELMLNRQLNLWNQEIGSKVELEQRKLAFESSQTSYQSALQKYDDLKKSLNFVAQQAQNNLSISYKNSNDYIVKSSINGKIYQININKGEMVSPQTPLAIVGDKNVYILEMQVDEYSIVSIKKGMKVLVVLNSYKDSVFNAIVTKINPIMNAQSKTFTIEATFTNSPSILYPSISFEANIVIETKQNALLIPRNYLLNDSVVMLKSGKQKIIKTGLKDFQMIEIISGLNKDDELILPKQ
ncbi:HlyD family efflux transporter periplasmic adaptor subunit [Flavobacterium filum]|uniref:efflux RND transporter periplasmic adaptor subunit n=1 Tax=Flavobacterium filum TaxID=370974 RepID=UPI0023F4F59A|nr:HlyD family efflux transporter periplasmic adaptor subunit [Flavobacterium filum]